MAPLVADGTYRLTRSSGHGATVYVAKAPLSSLHRIFMYPKTVGQQQDWILKNLTNGHVTLKNAVTNEYLGYPEIRQNEICGQTSDAVEWRLQVSAEKGKYHVMVPGGPVGGNEYALDIAPLNIYPPYLGINHARLDDQSQTWSLVKKN